MDIPQTDIEVELTGKDGNAFAILGEVSRAMKQAGVSQEIRDQYWAEATGGDYNHLLRVTHQYVHVT